MLFMIVEICPIYRYNVKRSPVGAKNFRPFDPGGKSLFLQNRVMASAEQATTIITVVTDGIYPFRAPAGMRYRLRRRSLNWKTRVSIKVSKK